MTAKANKLCKVCGEPASRSWFQPEKPHKCRDKAYGYWVYHKTCGKPECVLARQGKLSKACPICGEPVKAERVKTRTKGFRWNYHKTCGRDECKRARSKSRARKAGPPMSDEAKRELAQRNRAAYFEKTYASEIEAVGLDWVMALRRCIQSFESRSIHRLDAATMTGWERYFNTAVRAFHSRTKRVRRTAPAPSRQPYTDWEQGLRMAARQLKAKANRRLMSAWERKFETAASNWKRRRHVPVS